jgi:hypothetical protein
MRCWSIPILNILLSLTCLYANAQAASSVHGKLIDPSGSAVSGAPIQLQTNTGVSIAETTSSATGAFDFIDLKAGSFILKVPSFNGFAAMSVPIRIPHGPALAITLSPDRVVQTVSVDTSQSLSTDPTTNKDTVAYKADELRSVPVFDQDLVGALTPFLDPGSISSGGVSIVVDGVEMKSSTVSPSAIAEVRVNNDPYTAEFSRPGRGRIEIMTKPGSPKFHGEYNFIARDAAFNASNFFASTKPPEQRRIFEGNFTGPVEHGGRTTFLFSEDNQTDDVYAYIHAIDAQGLVTGSVNNPQHNNQTSFRITQGFSNAHLLSVAYNFELSAVRNEGVGGTVLAEAGMNNVGREDDLVFNDRIIVSPSIVQQLQVTLEKDEDVTSSLTNAPSILVDSSFTSGGAQADASRSENTIHISEVVSINHKNHYIRFGANIPQMSRRALDDHTNRLGTFEFNSIADYTAPTPTPYVFTVQQGAGRGIYWINEIGGFVQDQVKVNTKLLFTFGLRYQWQTYISDARNFAPRISAGYSPNTKTVLRAGSGIFFDRTGGDFPGTFKVHNGHALRTLQILNPGYPNPVPPGQSLTALPSSIVRETPDLRTPYTVQYSFSVERQLTPDMTLTCGYRGITGVRSFRSRDANAPLPPDHTTVPDPSLGFVQQIEAGGRLRSNTLDLALRGKAGRWFSGQAQYTLGRSNDNTGGISSYPQDQYNPNAMEWGPSNLDRRHRFNMIGTVNRDHWLSLGLGTTLYSGTPFTELAGTDEYNTGLGNARPAGVGRNTLRASGTQDVDALWDHDFKLGKGKGDNSKVVSVGISGFDVLNHPNFTNYVGNIRSSLFMQPTVAMTGRQLQFSFGFRF